MCPVEIPVNMPLPPSVVDYPEMFAWLPMLHSQCTRVCLSVLRALPFSSASLLGRFIDETVSAIVVNRTFASPLLPGITRDRL